MVREVVRDPMFLQRKSVEANMSDMPIAVDLLDTLKANFEGCVGTVSYTHLTLPTILLV